MDNVICLECRKACKNDSSLHRHLKAHKMIQKNYYHKHFPRHDKLDGKIIEYKTKDQYFSSDFNSRANLKTWITRASAPEAKEYVRTLLLERKERKKLIYAPTQVELRSLPIPGMAYLNNLFGNYYAECEDLGFKLKHTKTSFNGVWREFLPHHKIIIDTREQMPLSFPLKTIHEGLKFGDYKLNDDNFTHNCCIERKTLGDFYGTLTSGYERFCREVERAQQEDYYLIVLVEGLFEDMNQYVKSLKRMNIWASPEYVFHNMRELSQKYPMIQFLFVEDREEASEIILKLFRSNGQFKNVDLQYMFDTGKLL